jgi:aminoglycoside phosphotransferase family enzyme
VRDASDVTLADKVAFLRRADSFPDRPEQVEAIETHFAWVFLSRLFVYKLKKPIRFENVDFTHLGSRRANCELEITLNRRLAESVYIGVVPLVRSASGLGLEGDGEAVDWLVKMHRLPRARMLDAAAVEGTVTGAELEALAGKLAAFYRDTNPAPWSGSEYVRHLEHRIRDYGARLSEPELGLDAAGVERLTVRQCKFVRRNTERLQGRAERGRVVDAHGDLRPEHVLLADNPQIIDCLEFSTELRWLDTAEEISFLALECERLDRNALAEQLRTLYCAACEDREALALFDFYRIQRALVRALLSVWHVPGAASDSIAQHWLERANWYLGVAESSLAGA